MAAGQPLQQPLGVGDLSGAAAAAAPAAAGGRLLGGCSAGAPAAQAPAGGRRIGGGGGVAAPAAPPAAADIVSFGIGGGAAAPPPLSRVLKYGNTPPTISGSSDQVDMSLLEPEAEPKGGWPKDKANALLKQALASSNQISTALATSEQANAAQKAKLKMLTAVSCTPAFLSPPSPCNSPAITLRLP